MLLTPIEKTPKTIENTQKTMKSTITTRAMTPRIR